MAGGAWLRCAVRQRVRQGREPYALTAVGPTGGVQTGQLVVLRGGNYLVDV